MTSSRDSPLLQADDKSTKKNVIKQLSHTYIHSTECWFDKTLGKSLLETLESLKYTHLQVSIKRADIFLEGDPAGEVSSPVAVWTISIGKEIISFHFPS